MFLRVGLKAKNNVLDRWRYLFVDRKGSKWHFFNALFYLLVLLFYVMRDVSDMSAFDDIHLEIEYFNVQIIDK